MMVRVSRSVSSATKKDLRDFDRAPSTWRRRRAVESIGALYL
jgi:hypothetical protein